MTASQIHNNASARSNQFDADIEDALFADAQHQDHLDEECDFDIYEEFGLGRRHNQALY